MYLTGDVKRKVGVTIKQINRWTELGWVTETDKTENGWNMSS